VESEEEYEEEGTDTGPTFHEIEQMEKEKQELAKQQRLKLEREQQIAEEMARAVEEGKNRERARKALIESEKAERQRTAVSTSCLSIPTFSELLRPFFCL
jgi:hypothetical protein